MSALDLIGRLSTPVSVSEPVSLHSPWDDEGLRRVTHAIQAILRQEHPELLNPSKPTAQIQAELLTQIQLYISRDPALQLPGISVGLLARQVFDYVAGLGPIASLLERPALSEIMVNRYDDVWIEVEGRLQRVAGLCFRDDTHVFNVAQRVLAPLGIELSAARPLAQGRLPGNVRVAASMPPASVCTTLSIRKPALDQLTTEEYLKRGTATLEMLQFLQKVVRGRGNLLIAGPTGTGKSTLLRYLGSYFDPTARILVLEQLAELGLERYHPHVVSLEARALEGDGRAGPTMADLLQHALHRRPDYIVVGEVLGPEALQLLMAMATGHPGASTVHAQSPARLFDRLSLAMLQARLQISHQELLRYLAEAVDVVAYIERLADGSRKITMISEIEGMKDGNPVLRTLFRFVAESVNAERVTGSFWREHDPSDRLGAKLARWGVAL
ncbi:MAG: CpaF family protein [Mycobacterium leprae]